MSSLGSYLRELRQRRGVSLEEMSRATRVAQRYLEALEADEFRGLPAPVFAKGFVRAYCQVLQEPPGEALERFQAVTGDPEPAPVVPAAPRRGREGDRRSRSTVLVSFVLLVVLGLALFAVTLALQSWSPGGLEPPREARVAPASEAPRLRPPPEPRVAASTPRPAPSPPAAPSSVPDPPSASPPAPARAPGEPGDLGALLADVRAPYRLVARVAEPTWIRVRTEDGRSTEETVPAGAVREWVSNGAFVVTVGNAGGVTLELNGRTLPSLGDRGAVIQRLVLPPPR